MLRGSVKLPTKAWVRYDAKGVNVMPSLSAWRRPTTPRGGRTARLLASRVTSHVFRNQLAHSHWGQYFLLAALALTISGILAIPSGSARAETFTEYTGPTEQVYFTDQPYVTWTDWEHVYWANHTSSSVDLQVGYQWMSYDDGPGDETWNFDDHVEDSYGDSYYGYPSPCPNNQCAFTDTMSVYQEDFWTYQYNPPDGYITAYKNGGTVVEDKIRSYIQADTIRIQHDIGFWNYNGGQEICTDTTVGLGTQPPTVIRCP